MSLEFIASKFDQRMVSYTWMSNYENPELDDVFYLQPFRLRFLIHIIRHKPHYTQ